MIVFPKNWNKVGRHIGIKEIEARLFEIIYSINSNCLSLSGGLDSSLLLYYMCAIRSPRLSTPIKVFTAARSMKHPDMVYAHKVVEYFRDSFKHIDLQHYVLYIDEKDSRNGIKLFYEYIAKRTNEIIAGDGIDEFMGGYYDHQFSNNSRGQIYHDRIWNLQKDHLIPLNKNSGKVRVYLPYIDDSLIYFYAQIPLWEKVDSNARKKLMIAIAKGKVPEEVLTRRKYGFCDVV